MFNTEKFENELKMMLHEDTDLLNNIVEEITYYDGTFQDDVVIDMNELDDLLYGKTPIEILLMAFNGYSEGSTDDNGNHMESFNPNDSYFYFNGYGNLVSCYKKDYSDLLDDVVDKIMDDIDIIDRIDIDDLQELYDNNDYPNEYEIESEDDFDDIIGTEDVLYDIENQIVYVKDEYQSDFEIMLSDKDIEYN